MSHICRMREKAQGVERGAVFRSVIWPISKWESGATHTTRSQRRTKWPPEWPFPSFFTPHALGARHFALRFPLCQFGKVQLLDWIERSCRNWLSRTQIYHGKVSVGKIKYKKYPPPPASLQKVKSLHSINGVCCLFESALNVITLCIFVVFWSVICSSNWQYMHYWLKLLWPSMGNHLVGIHQLCCHESGFFKKIQIKGEKKKECGNPWALLP